MADEVERQIIQFDSSTSMLKALANFHHGRDFSGVGVVKQSPGWLADGVNALPTGIRREIYRWGGWLDALQPEALGEIYGEPVAKWTVSFYPERTYDGLMIGSSNGSIVHLGAAVGMPWLPQTLLLAARRDLSADQIREDIDWGRRVIRPFLDHNPDYLVHQMHDPLQDRLMVTKMGYFRIKKMRLGKTYEDFIRRNVKKGGRIITTECQYKWLKLRVQDRHTFQLGGFGGLKPEEYLNGGAPIREFLKKVGADVEQWNSFEPDETRVEAEWGFEEDLLEDVRRFARENGYAVERIVFNDPEALSPLIADFYKWWYEKRGIAPERLLLENFALLDPYWTLKTGSVPLWLAFNTDCSYKLAYEYVASEGPFKEIYIMLMSNGVPHCIGLTPLSEWRKILARATVKGDFLGIDPEKYPMDFGNFIRCHADLRARITARFEFPETLRWEDFEEFVTNNSNRYKVEILHEAAQTAGR